MKKLLILLLTLVMCLDIYAQPGSAINLQPSTPSSYWIKVKNYYLLTRFEEDKEVRSLLEHDHELTQIATKKIAAIKEALSNCKEASCLIDPDKFTPEEIKAVSGRLIQLYKPGNALDRLVKAVKASGCYFMSNNETPASFLAKAWEQDASGINYTIDVYAGGKKPNYPMIDSISFNVKAKRYVILTYDFASTLYGDIKDTKLFFEPSLAAALLYLQINERKDPANYEPMSSTANRPAVDHARIVNWNRYAYTVIQVPGAGPDNLTSPLSAEGMLRCRLAVKAYRDGKAPFIMVSGGKVHPYKTVYCEAEEMKKYLTHELGMPENIVIIEPHARHTTTNMRNCSRLMFKYGFPTNKPGLVVTDKSQTDGIMAMGNRCMQELKYMPYKLGKRLSETELEYYPLFDCMQINPYEPLDP